MSALSQAPPSYVEDASHDSGPHTPRVSSERTPLIPPPARGSFQSPSDMESGILNNDQPSAEEDIVNPYGPRQREFCKILTWIGGSIGFVTGVIRPIVDSIIMFRSAEVDIKGAIIYVLCMVPWLPWFYAALGSLGGILLALTLLNIWKVLESIGYGVGIVGVVLWYYLKWIGGLRLRHEK